MNKDEALEISIMQVGVPCGLIQKRMEPGYMLADGTVLLESERDANGCYRGGAGMDGIYLQTGQLYAPVCGDDGQIRAFREVRPENCLAAAETRTGRNAHPSVLDDLRQCQENARKFQGETTPPNPRRDER